MKFLFFSFLFWSFFSTTVFAQDVTTEYFDRDGKPIEKEAADFYKVGKKVRSIRQYDTILSYVDTVKTFYAANNRLRSKAVFNSAGQLSGEYLEFHENGAIKERGSYSKGNVVGVVSTYYSNGKVKMVRRYPDEEKPAVRFEPFYYQLLTYNDSTGKPLVLDGNGYCVCVGEKPERVEDGLVKGGFREGLWKEHRNDSLILEEWYEGGKFIRGKRYDQGRVVSYDKFEIAPTYPEGMATLFQWISKTLKYPKEARKKQIEGTVFVGFVIKEDGTITNVKVAKGVHPLIDDEAVRVITMMEKWNPGVQRGKAVKVKYVLPLKFKLGS
jgi:TonB family protein